MADLHFQNIPIIESGDPLVDLTLYPFVLVPAYFEQGLSNSPDLYTRSVIAEKLLHIQSTELKGYRFLIWDPWRSVETQRNLYQKFWAELSAKNPLWGNERLTKEVAVYVADPYRSDRVPPHVTGGSIDLTLVDATTGVELDMGTGFDHFGPEAEPNFFEHPDRNSIVRSNRRLLHEAMLTAGFSQDPDEWWHFDYGNQKWAEAVGASTAMFGTIAPR